MAEYDKMTRSEIVEVVRRIIATSSSGEEIRRRVRDELGYSKHIYLHIWDPPFIGSTAELADAVWTRLGMLRTKIGGMANAELDGPNNSDRIIIA